MKVFDRVRPVGVLGCLVGQEEVVRVRPGRRLVADGGKRRHLPVEPRGIEVVDLPDPVPGDRGLAVLEREVLRVLVDVGRAVALLDLVDHPGHALDAGLVVVRRGRAVLGVRLAAVLPQQAEEHQVGRPLVRHPERGLEAGRLELLAGVVEARRVLRGRGDPGLVEVVLVVVHRETVDVQRDAVALALIDPGLPDRAGEVRLLQVEGGREVVERDDHLAGRVAGQLVEVHRSHVRPLAGLGRGRQPLVEVRPLDGVGLDRDLVVFRVELLDQRGHRRAVAAGEPVPVGQVDRRALVGRR